MRVASRRLRAVLEIYEPCFPRKALHDVLADVKALADALGERRDPDVHLAAARGAAARRRRPTARVSRSSPSARARAGAGNGRWPPRWPSRAHRPARAGSRRLAASASRRARPATEPSVCSGRRSHRAGAHEGAQGQGPRSRRRRSPTTLERIVAVRLDELCSFMPRALDPAEVVALHDMRIAAKRLRYILEVDGRALLRPVRRTALKRTKDLQDLLGEIHDCDVQLPRVRALRTSCAPPTPRSRPPARRPSAATSTRRSPRGRRTRAAWRGLADARHLPRRRGASCSSSASSSMWTRLERDGFRARLEYAISERAEPARSTASQTATGHASRRLASPAALR